VKELIEWMFQFVLLAAGGGPPVPYRVAEHLMRAVVIPLASANDYTIGGGFRQKLESYRVPGPFDGSEAGEWEFRFGLAATEEGQLIVEPKAAELLETIKGYAASQGARVDGGFREPTEEECEPLVSASDDPE
jgi:hypothetical protein